MPSFFKSLHETVALSVILYVYYRTGADLGREVQGVRTPLVCQVNSVIKIMLCSFSFLNRTPLFKIAGSAPVVELFQPVLK